MPTASYRVHNKIDDFSLLKNLIVENFMLTYFTSSSLVSIIKIF